MRSENVVSMPRATAPPQQTTGICDDHGQFPQTVNVIFGRVFKTGCPECMRIAKDEDAERARINERYELSLKFGAALIPKRFATKTLTGYIADTAGQKEALRVCRKYVDKFPEISETGRCLLMLGKPGTGKTHLGTAIANELMRKTDATAVYRTLGTVLHEIRSTYRQGSERTEGQIIAALVMPSLLVLDEIGVSKEAPSDFELTTLFAIINGRYEQMRPTVIISNLDGQALPAAMGERCVDRLREGGVIVLPFEWESQRGKEGF
ncbi:DNA replication protein dnaC [Pseudomonas syringae pv. actinidiae]|uniref:DNA replication protein dnaC n=1 Tax=Pseudomonas syringae pv. actinidiae TaxID=103796 RepID=A0A7Z6UDS1_PSESF|nr:ATP-binding protein [Pseudomonas syringae]RMR53331.1 DNA replication protein dnaC [Pseudomonas syringae pv. actinidiae]